MRTFPTMNWTEAITKFSRNRSSSWNIIYQMPNLSNPKKLMLACLTTSLVGLGIAACSAVEPSPRTEIVVQTIEIPQVVTQIITVEVTRLVDEPVTSIPTDTPTALPTLTPAFSATSTRKPINTAMPERPRITILEHSACLYGPGSAYLFKYGLNATVWMTVIGRNMDGSWLNIVSAYDPDWNACWIKATLVKFDTGSIKDVPIVWTALPYSTLYQPPHAVSANRVGDEVSIFWQPVYMTEDDYRGYLIEAWVCQGGSQVFVPVGYISSFAENNGMLQNNSMMVVKIKDEPGCDVPSSARIYSVEKHGYTDYRIIHWPGFGETATPTATPTP